MKSIFVTTQEEGQRMDRFVGKYLCNAPKGFFYKMFRKKNIVLNGKKVTGGERLSAGDEIRLFLSDQTIEKFHGSGQYTDQAVRGQNRQNKSKIQIIHEDTDVLVLNKPAGILSQKAKRDDFSLADWVAGYVRENSGEQNVFKAGICNRLDRNTTGLVVAGKTVRGLQFMNRLFKERGLDKYYLCLVHGKISDDKKVKGYLRKDHAKNKVMVFDRQVDRSVLIETAYHPIEHFLWQKETYTLLQVRLFTGKSHQIRAHLQSMGHPVVGDVKYGYDMRGKRQKEDFAISHQLLHAWKLSLKEAAYLPEKYHHMEWTAPLPAAFERILEQMRATGQTTGG